MTSEMQQNGSVTNPAVPPTYANQAETQVYSIPPPPMHITNVVVQQSQQQPAGKDPFDILKEYIPAMPICLAVTLCALNTMSPGLGTFVSAFCCCCCSASDAQRGRCERFCINVCVAWLQVTSVFLFLLGWAWSIWWGVIFITKSASRKQSHQQPLMPGPTHHQPQPIPQAPVYPQHNTHPGPHIDIQPDEVYGHKQ